MTSNKKISELTEATSVSNTDYVPIVHSGGTERTSVGFLNGEVYNVKHYGAKGDGTTDDSDSINAALAAAGAATVPGVVVLPTAIYKLESTLVVPEGVTVLGQGSRLAVYHNGDGISLDYYTSLRDVYVEAADNSDGAAITTSGVRFWISLFNVWIREYVEDSGKKFAKGMDFNGSWEVTIQGGGIYKAVKNAGIYNAHPTEEPGNFVIEKMMLRTGYYAEVPAVYIENFKNVFINGCVIQNGLLGIHLNNVSGATITECFWEMADGEYAGNDIRITDSHGISVEGAQFCAGTTNLEYIGDNYDMVIRRCEFLGTNQIDATDATSLVLFMYDCVVDGTKATVSSLLDRLTVYYSNCWIKDASGNYSAKSKSRVLKLHSNADQSTIGYPVGPLSLIATTVRSGGTVRTQHDFQYSSDHNTLLIQGWNDGGYTDISLNPLGGKLSAGLSGTLITSVRHGVAVLVGGTKTVSVASLSADARIFLTSVVDGGTPGWLRVSALTPDISFVITSSSGTDTSTVAYLIIEP